MFTATKNSKNDLFPFILFLNFDQQRWKLAQNYMFLVKANKVT